MPTCPRCEAVSLEARHVHGVSLHACPGCGGVLIEQRRLVPLLEAMMATWGHEIDPDHPIEAVTDPGSVGTCPSCRGPTTTFGYMGMDLVHLDRCGACEVLWTDADELATVGVLFARTRRRTTMRRQAREDTYRDRRFSMMMQRQRMRGFLGVRGEVLEGLLDLASELG